MPMLLNRTLRLFLDSIGRREEYEYYLRRFHSQPGAAFAVLCPEASGFEEAAPFFMIDLDFLMRLDLFPAILLCGEAVALRELLEQGAKPPLYMDIESCLPEDGNALPEPIRSFLATCRESGRPAGFLAPGLSWGDALPRLLPTAAGRVHFIRVRGPLRTVSDVPLAFYYHRRPPPEGLAPEDRALAATAAGLLESRPGTHVSVASPWNLLQELFTVRGAGCVVRVGAEIRRLKPGDPFNEEKLSALLEESFGRRLHGQAYLDRIDTLYIGGAYEGAALVENHPVGAYLSKFAVRTAARGEGLANELWAVLTADNPRLFWRSRPDNPVNHWYEKQADGYHREGRWKVFWRGIKAEHLPAIIAHAARMSDEFAAGPDPERRFAAKQ